MYVAADVERTAPVVAIRRLIHQLHVGQLTDDCTLRAGMAAVAAAPRHVGIVGEQEQLLFGHIAAFIRRP